MLFFKHRRTGLWILTIAILTTGTGCSNSPPTWEPTDVNLIAAIIGKLSDKINQPEQLREMFSEKAIPDDKTIAELKRYMVKTKTSDVTVNGDTATVDIVFEITRTGELLGPKEWTMVRVGEQWKIDSTQFP